MVQDRQKVWTDGRTEGRTDGMDGRTHGRRQNYIPPTSSGDNKKLGTCQLSYCDMGLDTRKPVFMGFAITKGQTQTSLHIYAD